MAVNPKSIAIVAIPSQDDYVWKVSSEKVPHVTLLFLGEHLENESKVEEFIGHVVKTSLCRFMLNVDHRGVLGDKSADVLFFDESSTERLEKFRGYLLQNLDILKAYNAAAQYPTWTPHLTMGFPETPAKPDKRDYPGTRWVEFDRIALWTGDYEGVEFPLKNYDNDMAMSVQKGKAFLEHYGVKGMRWGVRRNSSGDTSSSGGKKLLELSSSTDHKNASFVRSKAKVSGVNTLSNHELQQIITRMNLEQQFKTLKRVEHEQSLVGMGKKWAADFVTDVAKETAASYIRRPGSSSSGKKPSRATDYAWGYGQQIGGIIETAPSRRSISR